jgi:hypothetical protein
MQIKTTLIALALIAAGANSQASGLMDGITSQLGNGGGSSIGDAAASLGGKSLGMPPLGSSSIGSAAGVIQYCVQNNYLAGGAEGIKDRLMEKFTGQKKQEASFADGAKGFLKGDGGKSFNMNAISGKLKTKACDYVLKSGTKLL